MYDLNLPSHNAIPHLRPVRRAREGTTARVLRAGAATVGKGIAALVAARARRRMLRDTVRQLHSLPDRLLQDVGLPRSEIWKVASDLVTVATRTPPRTGRE
jgi:uncharacterized protein YjiS (DUF1127 family)